jgi:hypothetical protein
MALLRGALVVLLALSAAGCGDGGPGAPSASPSPAAAPSPVPATPIPGAPLGANGVFDAAVVVDLLAAQTPQADIQRVMDRARQIVFETTGMSFRMTEVVYGLAADPRTRSTAAQVYATSVAANPPDGVVFLSADAQALSFGGYSFWYTPPFAFRNEYPSPRAGVPESALYVAVVDFDHAFGRCGYDDRGNRISDVSVGGECRNRPGTPCVRRPSGRAEWTCAGTEGELYADHDYFTACTVVHEFLHPFGIDPNANLDHYGSPSCTARTGMTAAQASDSRMAQLNCGMCPDVYARFRRRTGP